MNKKSYYKGRVDFKDIFVNSSYSNGDSSRYREKAEEKYRLEIKQLAIAYLDFSPEYRDLSEKCEFIRPERSHGSGYIDTRCYMDICSGCESIWYYRYGSVVKFR